MSIAKSKARPCAHCGHVYIKPCETVAQARRCQNIKVKQKSGK